VAVQDYSFKPGSITVKKGTTVTWTFKDSDAHNVAPTGSGNPLKKSPDLKSGGTYQATFDQVGTFTYQCGIHNFMSGSVTVTG
jgi:plastocyanin